MLLGISGAKNLAATNHYLSTQDSWYSLRVSLTRSQASLQLNFPFFRHGARPKKLKATLL